MSNGFPSLDPGQRAGAGVGLGGSWVINHSTQRAMNDDNDSMLIKIPKLATILGHALLNWAH